MVIGFQISPEQRAAKSHFWAALDINPICDENAVTLAAAQQLVREDRLEDWWKLPGFPEWFANKLEFEVGLDDLSYMAMATLRELMMDPDTPAAVRAKVAGQVIDAAGRNRSKNKPEEKQVEVGSMDSEQLKRLIAQLAPGLLEDKSGN